jgi:hypothetical protein
MKTVVVPCGSLWFPYGSGTAALVCGSRGSSPRRGEPRTGTTAHSSATHGRGAKIGNHWNFIPEPR